MGVTRAKQLTELKKGHAELGEHAMCVQLHGDGAFSGQGVVAEALVLSGLPHYGSGGTVHIIVK